MRRLWIALAFLGISAPALAQDEIGARKQARALRVAPGAITLDGRLDEAVWRTLPPVTDFVQKEPIEGAQPSDLTEIWFAYDDTAIYVGARMHANGRPIQAPMSRRDDGTNQAEHLLIELDSYLDRRTAYAFGVTASGVRFDHFHSNDNENDDDEDFNPVWRARTAREDGAWTAELWIPLSQLRFNLRDEQVWGLNVSRWNPLGNESVYWVPIPRTGQGWSSRFGELRGVDGVRPARRIELVPYVAAGATLTGSRDQRNPFDDGRNLEGRVGGDLKVGFGSNLTLDATVNPDFGQVEADPAEVNLSAFETFFDEKRPFFLEGTGTMESRFGNYFYTRRVGAAPGGSARGDFVDYPSTSTILGAAKLSGRLPSKTTIGMLGAFTASEEARTFSLATLSRSRVQVAPATTYGVARVQQEFGANTSTAAVMGTFVHRNLEAGGPLSSLLARNAFSINADTLLRFKGGEYELGLGAGLTHVDGNAASIDRLQRSSARYFQRPDATHVTYDPTRTSMTGAKADVEFERREGRHWLFGGHVGTDSPEFETNDAGRLTTSDAIYQTAWLRYRETQPGRVLRDYRIETVFGNGTNYAGDRQFAYSTNIVEVTWNNFWETEVVAWRDLAQFDQRLTRGGPIMRRPGGQGINLSVESSDAASTQFETEWSYFRGDGGVLRFESEVGMSWRPSPSWEIELNPTYERSVEPLQYVTTLDGGRPETFGRRYVFAEVDRSTWSTEIRVNYTMRPDLTVDVYAEPFAASGRYAHFGELAAPRTDLLLPTVPVTAPDFNRQSFRSNVVLRWEWRPGSTFYFVWQQNREESELLPTRASLSDMFASVGARGDNVLAVKASLWLSRR